MQMMRGIRAGLVLAIGSAMGLSIGCNSSGGKLSPEETAEIARERSMEEVGQMLRVRNADAKSPPAKLTELVRYAPGFPGGYGMVEGGDVVLMLGAPIEDGASDKVLAFEKQAPETGGYVLMQDGTTVKKMSADEFRAAPRAPGTPTTDKKGA